MLVDFPPEVLEKLVIGDKVLVKAFGVSLKLLDFPGVKVMNMDPRFLDALGIRAIGDKLEIPVTHVIPAAIMGSGLGANQTYTGDYDIQLFDEGICRNVILMISDSAILWPFSMLTIRMEEYIEKARFSVGIVVHANCMTSGHGPGVTTLFTSASGKIIPKIDSKANIAYVLKLRTDI